MLNECLLNKIVIQLFTNIKLKTCDINDAKQELIECISHFRVCFENRNKIFFETYYLITYLALQILI